MIRHTFLIAFRHFSRNKKFFLINQVGLSFGLATTILVLLWVYDEWKVDKFHQLDTQLYRLISDSHSNETVLNTSSLVANHLASALPEIEAIVNSSWGALVSSLSNEEEQYAVTGEFATSAFFELFSYPLILGKADQVLQQPASIVLSEATAAKLFGSTDIIGKSLQWQWYNMREEVIVTGIYQLPAQSSMQFDYILSFDIFEKYFKERIDRGHYNTRTYLKIKKNTDPQILNQKIEAFIKEQYPDWSWVPFVIPYASYYLQNVYNNREAVGGRIVYLRQFFLTAILILFIACVNFINLTTARASRRMKEMGIKKTIGATRVVLAYQHFIEAILQSLIAGGIAIILLLIFLPSFNQFVNKALKLPWDAFFLLSFVAITILTGIVSGSYPALYLSLLKPHQILKGNLKRALGEEWLRKGLVIFQFGISTVMILSVWIIHEQMQFLQHKNLGYEKEQILTISTNGMPNEKQKEFISNVSQIAGVVGASSLSHALVGGQASTADIRWEGKAPESEIWFEHGTVNYGMLEILNIELVNGRFFSKERGNEAEKLVINEKAQQVMGFDNAVGKSVQIGETNYEIIGVTQDFHFESLHELVKPTFFRWSDQRALKIAVKIESFDEQKTLAKMEELYKRFHTGFPFQFTFLSEDYQQKYAAEEKVSMLSRFAAALAIIISCLGLLGLSSFMAEKRTKEIGIRKILGASSQNIVRLLTIEYSRIVILAILLAVPLGYWVSSKWLNSFAYHINLNWIYFIGAGMATLSIAWLTMGFHTFKAANFNPIDCLSE